MNFILLGLGLVFLVTSVIGIRRNKIYSGGRLTRSEITGNGVLAITVPRIVVGAAVVAIALSDIAGVGDVDSLLQPAIYALLGTYLITNLVVGGYYQFRSNRDRSKV